jgi:hypothetical protein
MMPAYAGGRRRWGSSPGGGGRNGLEVDSEAGQAGVAALGHEEREGHSGFGEVGEAGVPDWATDTLTRVEAQLAGGYACYLALSNGSWCQPPGRRVGDDHSV